MTRFRFLKRLSQLLICLTLCAGVIWWSRPGTSAKERPPPQKPAPNVAKLQAQAERITPLHRKMSKPQPGDWLAEHKEAGQTFQQYLRSRKRPLRDEYTTLYIQPFGKFTPTQTRLVKATSEFLGCFFGVSVKQLPTLALDDLTADEQRVTGKKQHRQLLTHYFLDKALPKVRQPDAIAVLGLVADDLWPGEGWNYVFGQASLTERVGIWSIQRFGNPDASDAAYQLCLRRTLGVAVHETGHMLGIPHCIAYVCGMNGSNSLEESDRSPLSFCPECEQKVWWTCRANPRERYRLLVEFARAHKLEEEAEFWQQSLEALPK